MENASKALIMAGGVLIALMIVSLLVVFRGNINSLMASKETAVATEQTAQFNSQFDVYNRNNVAGSELLTLINKINDYNFRYENDDGYQRINISVKFTNGIDAYGGVNLINTKTVYNQENLSAVVKDIESKIKSTKNERIGGRTIESISGMRTNQLEQLFEGKNIEISVVQEKINNYLSYRSALSNLKSKTFKVDESGGFEYDRNNGRIIKMSFIEN